MNNLNFSNKQKVLTPEKPEWRTDLKKYYPNGKIRTCKICKQKYGLEMRHESEPFICPRCSVLQPRNYFFKVIRVKGGI